jgi:hypothetical protein
MASKRKTTRKKPAARKGRAVRKASPKRPAKRAAKPAAKRSVKRKAKSAPKRPARAQKLITVVDEPSMTGPPPPPADAVEVSGIYGRVLYSESDPVAEIREIFNHYDRDRSGRIEASEFARLCDALGADLDEDELAAGLSVVDKNGDGKVSWTEFLPWWQSTRS